MRAKGFYWCKNPSGEWEVSMWVPEGEFKQGWRVVRDWEIYQDSYFQEIDERRIERNPTITVKGSDIIAVQKRDNDHKRNNGI